MSGLRRQAETLAVMINRLEGDSERVIRRSLSKETKELLLSQGLIAFLAIFQVRVVATNLGPEEYGNIGVYLGLVGLSFRILSSRNSDLVLINFKSTHKNFLNSAIYFEILLGIVSLIFVYGIFFVYYNFFMIPQFFCKLQFFL